MNTADRVDSQYIVDRLGLYVQAYTLYSSVRPFGCSTILGAVDKNGPALYVIEPSGVAYVRTSRIIAWTTDRHFVQGYRGAAVGKGRQLAKTELEKLKFDELSMREAVMEAARMYVHLQHHQCPSAKYLLARSIYLVHDDAKEKDFELEMSWVGTETNGVHLPVPKDLFDEASRKAKAALEDFE